MIAQEGVGPLLKRCNGIKRQRKAKERTTCMGYLCKEGLHVSILGLNSNSHIIWPCVVIFALSLNK
jgi:hypothetical protein